MPKTNPSTSYLQRRRWSETEARAALAALEASGLSTAEFARRQGLEPHRLYRWQGELQKAKAASRAAGSPSPPALVEIHPRRAEPVEIILGSGRVMRVSETIDVAALARLIGVLDQC